MLMRRRRQMKYYRDQSDEILNRAREIKMKVRTCRGQLPNDELFDLYSEIKQLEKEANMHKLIVMNLQEEIDKLEESILKNLKGEGGDKKPNG